MIIPLYGLKKVRFREGTCRARVTASRWLSQSYQMSRPLPTTPQLFPNLLPLRPVSAQESHPGDSWLFHGGEQRRLPKAQALANTRYPGKDFSFW